MADIEDGGLSDSGAILDLLSELVNRYRASDHVITYCNASWAAQYSVDRQTAIGRRLNDLLSADELNGMHAQLELLGPDRPVAIDVVARAVPGVLGRWLEWVDRYVLTENGPEVKHSRKVG